MSNQIICDNSVYNLTVPSGLDPKVLEIINPNQPFDNLCCGLNEKCTAMAFDEINNILYCGGKFTKADKYYQNSIAAYDVIGKEWLNIEAFKAGIQYINTNDIGIYKASTDTPYEGVARTLAINSMKIDKEKKILYITGLFNCVNGIPVNTMIATLDISTVNPVWININSPENLYLNQVDYVTVLPPFDVIATAEVNPLCYGAVNLSWTPLPDNAYGYSLESYIIKTYTAVATTTITNTDLPNSITENTSSATTTITNTSTTTITITMTSIINGKSIVMSDVYTYVAGKDIEVSSSTTNAIIKSLTVGTRYAFTVSAKDKNGTISVPSMASNDVIPGNDTNNYLTYPKSPVNVSIVAESRTSLTVSWSPVPLPYNIIVNTGTHSIYPLNQEKYCLNYYYVVDNFGNFTTVDKTETSVLIEGLKPYQYYYYSVVAEYVDSQGVKFLTYMSYRTGSVLLGGISPQSYPLPPLNAYIDTIDGQRYLYIFPNQLVDDTPISYYSIYCYYNNTLQTIKFTSTGASPEMFSLLGIQNVISVTTVDINNNPSISRDILSYAGVPYISAFAEDSAAQLSWGKPINYVPKSYIIEVYDDTDTLLKSILFNPTGSLVETVTIDELTNEVVYYFQVVAINSFGILSTQNISSNQVKPSSTYPITRPSPPVNLIAVAKNREVHLSWEYNYVIGGNPIDYYVVNYIYNGNNIEIMIDGDLNEYVIGNLQNDVEYFFYLQAVDSKTVYSTDSEDSNAAIPNSTIEEYPIYLPKYFYIPCGYSFDIYNNTLYVGGQFVLNLSDYDNNLVYKQYSLSRINTNTNTWYSTFINMDIPIYKRPDVTGSGIEYINYFRSIIIDKMNNTLYVGGAFLQVGYYYQNNIASIDLNTNTWNNIRFFINGFNNVVYSLAICEKIQMLYVGGVFAVLNNGDIATGMAQIDIQDSKSPIFVPNTAFMNMIPTINDDNGIELAQSPIKRIIYDKDENVLYVCTYSEMSVNGVMSYGGLYMFSIDKNAWIKKFNFASNIYDIYIDKTYNLIYMGGIFNKTCIIQNNVVKINTNNIFALNMNNVVTVKDIDGSILAIIDAPYTSLVFYWFNEQWNNRLGLNLA